MIKRPSVLLELEEAISINIIPKRKYKMYDKKAMLKVSFQWQNLVEKYIELLI